MQLNFVDVTNANPLYQTSHQTPHFKR